MFWRKPAATQPSSGSIIGKGTRIVGEVRFSGSLHVDGEVEGSISVPGDRTGTLTVGRMGRIAGEIAGSRVVIDGTVSGPKVSGDVLELQSQARVAADLHYGQIGIQAGAAIQGRLIRRAEEEAHQPLRVAAAPAAERTDVKRTAA